MPIAKRNESQAGGTRKAWDAADDAELLTQVARGDISAFESLYRRYRPRVRRFLEQRTKGPHLIEEILNDTMLVIWRSAGTFKLRSTVSTWILGIALRRGLKAVETPQRAATLELDEVGAPSDLEEQIFRKEVRARLDHALESLSPEHRTVVVLTYFEGYSCREIARIVGCPVDTVKTRMFYARRRLKALLSDRREDAA